VIHLRAARDDLIAQLDQIPMVDKVTATRWVTGLETTVGDAAEARVKKYVYIAAGVSVVSSVLLWFRYRK